MRITVTMSIGVRILHPEVGAARMGLDARTRTSVVNRFNQAHDVKTIFAVRAGDYITKEYAERSA